MSDNTPGEAVVKNYRLSKNVRPSRYELTLTPDLAAYTFTGEETIEVKVLERTNTIDINAKELQIAQAIATKDDGTQLDATITIDEDTELATLTFGGYLGAGDWKLFLRFSGTLNDKLKGFYRSIWTLGTEKRTIATTQFESTDARRAFPCFDEPDFKATYKVRLIVDENLTAISNGRIISQTAVDDGIRFIQAPGKEHARKKVVEFAETMKMSTYLVAFIVGDFVSSKPVFVNGKELRVWCVPGKEHLTSFALRSAAFAVAWYEKRYGIPYPGGDKIDFIAIPDFAAGAMENLGCITFRETALLLDEKTATQGEFERVDEVVKHELAHMWFGDLVTMRWWNGLWLNEAFATHESHNCMHAEYPEWHIWDSFGAERSAAARVDALKSTHPIESPVNHPDDAQELFDVISYEKGCSVLYQIEHYIGTPVFVAGVSKYLKQHSFGNTETYDLWDALEAACKEAGLDIPVRRIMDAWVFTAGHPMVKVTEGDADGFVTLTQRPFRFIAEEGLNTRWPIPVTMRVTGADGQSEIKKFVLDTDEQTVFVGKGYKNVVVNAGGTGFFRVTYSPSLASKLTADVQNTLTVIERFNLVNDTWASVRAGMTSTPDYLSMVSLFNGETNPNVWSIITGALEHLHSLLPALQQPALQKLVVDLVKPTADRLGWTPAGDETVHTRQLRASLLSVLGTIGGDASVHSKAKELFAAWKKDKTAVDANLVPALVEILAHHGDDAQYKEFAELAKAATTPQDEQRFLFALAGFRNEALLKRTINATLSGEVRTQDAPYLLASVLRNDVAAKAAWDFIVANWDKIVAAYPENGVVRLAGAVTGLDTPEFEAAVVKFFADHEVKSGEMAVAQALEQLRINVSLRERESHKLSAHISSICGSPATPVVVADPPTASDGPDGFAS
jgi:puromycin-sensitive aminopeptidase